MNPKLGPWDYYLTLIAVLISETENNYDAGNVLIVAYVVDFLLICLSLSFGLTQNQTDERANKLKKSRFYFLSIYWSSNC